MAMTMFSKRTNDAVSVFKMLCDSCDSVNNVINNYVGGYTLNTYEDWLRCVLDICENNLPLPTSWKKGAGLAVGPNYFTLTIPNEFKLGIKFDSKNDEPYLVDIIFPVSEEVMKTTDEYDQLINSGWYIREMAHK